MASGSAVDGGMAVPHDEAMRRADTLAARGLGTASPNPVVGCVLLDSRGQAWSARASTRTPAGRTPRSSRSPRRASGPAADRAWSPRTLQPHRSHRPLHRALIQAGVARVVLAVPDPNPVAGGGAVTTARRRSRGAHRGPGRRGGGGQHRLADRRTARRPYVIWKYAATLDGRSAAADGTSMWITSEAARMDVHALRGTVDAVIAGVGTVLADDPRLTARNLRDGTLAIRQPLRVVVDSTAVPLPTPGSATAPRPTWVATVADVGAGPDGRVDLPGAAARAVPRGIRAALLEGGPRLAGAFLAAGLVDRVVGYVAPKVLGAGPAALADAGVDHRRGHRAGVRRRHSGWVRTCGSPRCHGRRGRELEMFTAASSKSSAKLVSGRTPREDSARWSVVTGAAGHLTTPGTATRSRSTASA